MLRAKFVDFVFLMVLGALIALVVLAAVGTSDATVYRITVHAPGGQQISYEGTSVRVATSGQVTFRETTTRKLRKVFGSVTVVPVN